MRDGWDDARDANGLGACDDHESGLSTGIPGGDTPQCGLDCGGRCYPGVQAGGLSIDPACVSGYFCLTGCCILFG